MSARRPRVIDVTQWYSPTSGGIRTYLHAKAAWAAAEGRAHAAIVTGGAPGEDPFPAGRSRTVRGRTPTARWGYRVALRPGPVLDALERLEPDVVVLHDPLAFPRAIVRWARARGIPVAMFCHSSMPSAVSGLPRAAGVPLAGLLHRIERRGVRSVDWLMVATPGMAAVVAPHVRVPVAISPLGIDTRVFAGATADAALRERLLDGWDRHLLLYAGRLSSEKRLDLLPRMLAALDDDHVLVIAGTGAARTRLMRESYRLGVLGRMRFVGHLSDRTVLATLMATADCFVHPTPGEPFGLAPLEALAAGCRVVAADSPGPRQTVGGRGGILVAPDDPAAMAAGVRRALGTPRPRWNVEEADWRHTFRREWANYEELVT